MNSFIDRILSHCNLGVILLALSACAGASDDAFPDAGSTDDAGVADAGTAKTADLPVHTMCLAVNDGEEHCETVDSFKRLRHGKSGGHVRFIMEAPDVGDYYFQLQFSVPEGAQHPRQARIDDAYTGLAGTCSWTKNTIQIPSGTYTCVKHEQDTQCRIWLLGDVAPTVVLESLNANAVSGTIDAVVAAENRDSRCCETSPECSPPAVFSAEPRHIRARFHLSL